MLLSDKTLGFIKLLLSSLVLLYAFFLLMIIPILPIDDTIFETLTPPSSLLLICGVFGMCFIGFLSIFTLFVMCK